MRLLNGVEAVGRDCKKELLRNPLGRSDCGDDFNARDNTLRLPFGGILTMVVPLTPTIPLIINLH